MNYDDKNDTQEVEITVEVTTRIKVKVYQGEKDKAIKSAIQRIAGRIEGLEGFSLGANAYTYKPIKGSTSIKKKSGFRVVSH